MEANLHVKVDLVQRQGRGLSEFPEVLDAAMEEYRTRQRYSEVVVNTIRLIDKQWGDSMFSLQTAADALHVTPNHLSRVFHRETGDTFGSCLAGKRIREAMRLLQNSSLKMYEVAERTGYSSQHYFSSAFKRALGISPAEYRKNILE